MKKILVLTIAFFLIGCFSQALPTTLKFGVGLAEAAQVTLAWDPNPENIALTIIGHTLRFWEISDPSTVYTKTVGGDVFETTVPVPPGDWRFTVECFTTQSVSEPSTETPHAVETYTPPIDNLPVDDPAPSTNLNLRML